MYGIPNSPNLDKDSSQIVVCPEREAAQPLERQRDSPGAGFSEACIDDNVDMVTFLVEHGASIDQPDNEGWLPLHAASSCGYLDIAAYLISQGANVGGVNSEGETPLDIAEEEAMEELLQNEINRQGVDIEAARKEEERVMLRDARQWLNSGQIQDVRHAKSGGTSLHVAAAKGYVEVLKLLIQAGYDVNIKDYDGWTPLHAAAHWGKEEACRILVENLCDMDLINKMGQTAFDVADEDVLGYLEELQKKQNLLMSSKKDVKKSPLIETTTTGDNNQSLKPLKSKETLLLEPEKSTPRIETLEPEKVDEEEEGKKDESSCSSEEEEDEDSESETEAEKTKPSSASVSNSTTTTSTSTVSPPTSPTNQVTSPTSPIKKATQPAGKATAKVDEERKDESPASWRLGLRKTGSYGALAEITATKEAQREKDTSGVMRSASSPRLSSSLDNKDKEKEKDKGTRLAYVAPTIPRRLASASDIDEKENRGISAAETHSSAFAVRRWNECFSNASLIRASGDSSRFSSGSFGRRHEDLSSTTSSPSSSTTTTTSSSVTSTAGLRGLGSSARTGSTSLTSRYWSEESAEREKEKEKESAAVIPTINTGSTTTTTSTTTSTATSTTTTSGAVTGQERRRSYLTPVRDEESESQRKARSRQARQSRRSTQGVTLTDLQEAEKTIGRSRPIKTREEEKEEKEKQDKEKQEEKKDTEIKEEDYRSKYRSYEEVRPGLGCFLHLDRLKLSSRLISFLFSRLPQRYRPLSSSSSSTSAISTASTASTPSYSSTTLSSSSLNRPNSLTGITSSYSRSSRDTEKETDRKEEEKEGEDKSQPRSIRDRRRPREKRRSTGVSFWTQDVRTLGKRERKEVCNQIREIRPSRERRTTRSSSRIPRRAATRGSHRNELTSDRNDSLSSRGYGESRRIYSSRLDRDDATDYKKVCDVCENPGRRGNREQRQERYADRSQLEMEKRERRALERKISEMEEELKTLPDLKADNQRLKDENGALIRVISKLSK
ncbi:unnamed protein product [Tetraodon nigroviridis]|uniref:Protein phosphatase 1 regulatory subunit n=1 Tax=Tetraodon nigroviridis TaxID=99883 RepID=Q4S5E1_TETNG|nr:unnamed protein product [Tetraodon nigroviridis]